MLTAIRLSNFKCFQDTHLRLAPLTVLSGVNGMGKSSVLQALLILRQSTVSDSIRAEGALLNGPLVSLGNADDVLYDHAGDVDDIEFELHDGKADRHIFQFAYDKAVTILPNKSSFQEAPSSLHCLSGADFYYLKAERLGPRTSFPYTDHEMARYNPIGNAGEYAAHLLAIRERSPVALKELCHDKEPLAEVRAQVEAWLSEVGQPLRIHLTEFPRMDLVEMRFSFVSNGLPSLNYRPTNVGFGITYSLPIFVASMIAKPGSMILLENPEAHLHPKGQVAVGKFLSKVAGAGIQVIIETHSDHVLNGIRIGVKSGLAKPEEVALHFFDRKAGASETTVASPMIDADGRIDVWPDGFFDEWEKGLAELL